MSKPIILLSCFALLKHSSFEVLHRVLGSGFDLDTVSADGPVLRRLHGAGGGRAVPDGPRGVRPDRSTVDLALRHARCFTE